MESISETDDLYGRSAGTGLWERGCSQKNTDRTSNMDVSISQAKQSENEYMMQAGSCLSENFLHQKDLKHFCLG